jgi:2'-5' RNA ligase
MSSYRVPAYVVLEIPPPIRDAIQSIRESLRTVAARLPVEITVAGSSGIGPIPAGTNRSETEIRLQGAVAGLAQFRARFEEVRCFPNTNIFYLAPQDRRPFDRLHEALKASEIAFDPSPWPYNPHCTLRGGPMVEGISAEDIFGLSFPKEEFAIDSISIYELEPLSLTCDRTFQAKL